MSPIRLKRTAAQNLRWTRTEGTVPGKPGSPTARDGEEPTRKQPLREACTKLNSPPTTSVQSASPDVISIDEDPAGKTGTQRAPVTAPTVDQESAMRPIAAAELNPPPISAPRATTLAVATVAIAARITDPLHGGLDLPVPEPAYTIACAATLIGAIGMALVAWVLRHKPRCRRLRLRAVIEKGPHVTSAERHLALGWGALGLHAAVGLLG